MAKISILNMSATITGDGLSGAGYTPPNCPATNYDAPYGGPVPIVLASGDNAIAVPKSAAGTYAKWLMLTPPAGSVVAKKLGLGADTGWPVDPVATFTVTIPLGTTTVHINAGAGETCQGLWG